MDNQGTLKWRFDVSTFQLIGRELITDRVTALFELVKNSYDANAKNVTVTFENVQPSKDNPEKTVPGSRIIIEDDGYGMSLEDIRDKWMVIGTSSKRRNKISPAPFNRRCVGEKGIGRFAVDKLGNRVNIITKKAGEKQYLNVEINWTLYEQQENAEEPQYFTDIENKYSYEQASSAEASGTRIVVTEIREPWESDDIKHFIEESSRIVSPFERLLPPFSIRTIAKEYGIDDDGLFNQTDLKIATITKHIGFSGGYQESLIYNKEKEDIETIQIPLRIFGGIDFTIFFFDKNARAIYRSRYNQRIDGVKIYRDKMLATPFVEAAQSDDKKRDILGIDKRLWISLFDKISTREFIGIINITKEGNPKIIDATNRQDFIDNQEYRELKSFIIKQLTALEEFRADSRKKEKVKSDTDLYDAGDEVRSFANAVDAVAQENPFLKPQLAPIVSAAKKVEKAFNEAIKNKEREEKEYRRKESMYMGVLSLHTFAVEIAHAVRTSLGKIQRKAFFFNRYYPDAGLEQYFKLYAHEIYDEMKVLDKVVNFMLSYSQTNVEFVEINMKELVDSIFDRWKQKLDQEGITLDEDISENINIKTNMQFFVEIFENLIDNSIKALKDVREKRIHIDMKEVGQNLEILVSDNGCGIPLESREWVFGLYNTTTETLGGAGVGLYIVRSRVESLKGSVVVSDGYFAPAGVGIKMSIPIKLQ